MMADQVNQIIQIKSPYGGMTGQNLFTIFHLDALFHTRLFNIKGRYPYKVLFNFRKALKKYRKAEYVQRRVRFVNVQSSLHENVVFSVCARMCNAAYVIFVMWNSISGLDALYHLLVVVWLSW